MGTFMGQIRMVTSSGIKGKDDCIDTISMLGFLSPWRPSDSIPVTQDEVEIWDEQYKEEETGGLSSYIV